MRQSKGFCVMRADDFFSLFNCVRNEPSKMSFGSCACVLLQVGSFLFCLGEVVSQHWE